MFGTIIFIPLYLQLVYGASATSSGLRMLPLIMGLLVASVASGRTITRIGRYRPFPIAGTFIVSVGMFLLSLLAASTPSWVASVYMLIVGLGLGMVMQVLVLAVQNDATPETMGAATAASTFFRSVGGSFGVAIFGTVFASRLADQFAHLPRSVTSHLNLSGGVHLDPAQAKRLPPGAHEAFLHSFANALHGVFLWGLGFMALAFLLSWALREVPLREKNLPPTAPEASSPAMPVAGEPVAAR
jgi:MFS family permease